MPAPLKLVHYTGSDKLAEVMAVCPKIRTFKLFVTESLPKMGATLKNCDNSLDHVTLVYSPRCAYGPRSLSSLFRHYTNEFTNCFVQLTLPITNNSHN